MMVMKFRFAPVAAGLWGHCSLVLLYCTHIGVDPGKALLRAADPPADDAAQDLGAVVGTHQGSPAVALFHAWERALISKSFNNLKYKACRSPLHLGFVNVL